MGFGSSPFSDGLSAPGSADGSSAGVSVTASAVVVVVVFFLRPRPPRVPRRVFFFGFSSVGSPPFSLSPSAMTARAVVLVTFSILIGTVSPTRLAASFTVTT